MTLGYEGSLFLLAFDHRGSLQKGSFGIPGVPNHEEVARIVDSKRLIFEGLVEALEDGGLLGSAGVLVDEQFGADVARETKEKGLLLAMPVERSSVKEFVFEYGADFGEHVEAFDPTFAKALVRYNPEGDAGMNARQAARLKELSDWLHARERKFIFELLVPAEPHHLSSVGGESGRYDVEVRPLLMEDAIRELHGAGVEPDIWKIEGLERREDCERMADVAREGGRDGVACVVLGRGADADAVNRWLLVASGVPGYAGFAIGRSIWWDPLRAFVDGDLGRGEAAARIGANYLRFIDVYQVG